MSTLTIRLPATKHQRLKDFARARGVSLNKLVEEWANVALAQPSKWPFGRSLGSGSDEVASKAERP